MREDATNAGSGTSAPRTVRAATWLLAAEGGALLLLGVGYGIAGLVEDTTSGVAATEYGAAMAVLTGVLLLLLARGVTRRRRWIRSPAVLVQLFALPVAWDQIRGGVPFIGVPVLVLAVVTLGVMLSPSITRQLGLLVDEEALPELRERPRQ